VQRNYDDLATQMDANPLRSNGSPPEPTVSILTLRRGSEIPIEPISWLWPEWLAAGNLHVLGGVPGTGKTTIALSIAATVTSSGKWPDGTPCARGGNVVIWSGEDDAATTLIPRLTAMGADLRRIHIVSDVSDEDGKRPFDPAHDVPLLIEAARKVGDVSLLIVDPIVTSVAGDSHKNAEVRRGLAPLVEFAHGLRAAVLGITHFSKGTAGRDPLDRVTGSLAFGALARLVFGAARKLDDEGNEEGRVFVRIKSNLGPDGGALTYQLTIADLPGGIATSRVSWGGMIQGSARDILADAEQTDADHDDESALGDATQCLGEILCDGQPHEANEVTREARDAGHAERTIRRAREKLGIRPERNGKTRKWYWQLSGQDGQIPRTRNDGHLGHLAQTHPINGVSPERGAQDGQGGHESVFGADGHLGDAEVF
jgi:putative DNA primase/helicase